MWKKRSKRTRATSITTKEAYKVYRRDGKLKNNCLFCDAEYHMDKADSYGLNIHDLMHFIPRSKGGLGTEENLVLGCRYHHMMLDNGSGGHREEMLSMMEGYLTSKYREWNKNSLVYSKWGGDYE